MSGETEKDVSAWTIDSLRYHLEQIAADLDKRYEQRFAAQEKAVENAFDAQEVHANGELDVIRARLRGMDEATKVLHETVTRFPTDVQLEVGHLKEVHGVKFEGIEKQFEERDVRTQQASTSSNDALAAALQAAKELVGAQGEASAAAAVKSETSFTKQIDQIGTIIQTLEKALDARITELKERIDRGEGGDVGRRDQVVETRAGRNEQRMDTGQLLAILVAVIALAGLAVTLATR